MVLRTSMCRVQLDVTHELVANSFWTSVQALYNPKHLGLVEPPAKVAKHEWVLIYGGSSECP